MNRLVLLTGILLVMAGLIAQAAVTGEWRVTVRRGSTNQATVTGETLDAAYAACRARMPTQATSSQQWSCETPRYVAVVTPDPMPPVPGTAVLSWTPPTVNTNGAALTNLAGYRIVYGTSATVLSNTVQVANPSTSRHTLTLAPGTYYFAVKAYTSAGTESANSNLVTKVVQ